MLQQTKFENPLRKDRKSAGFTLAEILIVIVVIGVLTAIAVPAYLGQRERAAHTEAKTNLQAARLVLEQYFAENGCYYRTGGACTNTTLANTAAIKTAYPGFKPGNEASLKFDYSLVIAGAPVATTFTLTATGKSASPVAGATFSINQNNVRTGF